MLSLHIVYQADGVFGVYIGTCHADQDPVGIDRPGIGDDFLSDVRVHVRLGPDAFAGIRDRAEINDGRSFTRMYSDMEGEGLQPVLNDYLYV